MVFLCTTTAHHLPSKMDIALLLSRMTDIIILTKASQAILPFFDFRSQVGLADMQLVSHL